MIAPASRKVGKYEIVQKLGRGGMADVYLAKDSVLGHRLALKLIEHAEDADTRDAIDAERRGSALQARLAAVDPRVAGIYDTGDVDGFFYVAMEYVDGQDLSELMRRAPVTQGFAVNVAIAVAETLEKAHTLQVEIRGKQFHGIVHGDIKPKNIRIDSHDQVRVLDFGIAKALSLSRRLTRNDFGSVGYGSPERLESGEVNEQSDLWSLGVMLYEMVTGLQPYQAASTELLERMIRSHIPPPPAPDPCPQPLRRILMKAMSPDPEDRYPSAREFREDLIAFREGMPVQAILEDLDVTRRSGSHKVADNGHAPAVPPPVPDGDTHRTAPGDETHRTIVEDPTTRTVVVPEAPEVWGPKKKARKPSPIVAWVTGSLWGRRALAAVVLLGAIWAVWAGISGMMLYRQGAQLEQEIAEERVTDPNVIWSEWNDIAGDNPSSWLLHGARKAVEQRLVAVADRVLDSFRNDASVPESSWKNAQMELQRALTLDPSKEVRGKLRVTEGYLLWLASRRDRSGTAMLADLNQAVERFREAEQLIQTPDPELGLALVYAYGLADVDKANDALLAAEKRGHPMGNREKAFLADGYRDRAERLLNSSRNMRGLPSEKDLLIRARDDYQRAITNYQAIVPYAKSSDNIVKIQGRLEDVNQRLKEIDDEANGIPHANLQARRKIPAWLSALLRAIAQRREEKQ